MTWPIVSSARSSAAWKRTHALPMSSLLPAALKPVMSRRLSVALPYAGIRCSDRYDFSDASATYQSGCPLYVSAYRSNGT
ncbi:hypothetical protein D3C83_203540 [compost metagenome]